MEENKVEEQKIESPEETKATPEEEKAGAEATNLAMAKQQAVDFLQKENTKSFVLVVFDEKNNANGVIKGGLVHLAISERIISKETDRLVFPAKEPKKEEPA